MTKLPNTVHTARPWRVHEITSGFRLEDVWELPTPGGRHDFHRLVELVAAADLTDSSSAVVRALVTIRLKLGEVLGWDHEHTGLGDRVATLRGRLPHDLLTGPKGPAVGGLPFTPLYMTENEWAAEAANQTMHGLLHLGWAPDGSGHYRGQLAVYVRPNGLMGEAYMAAIRPFRYLFVYPTMLREIGRAWADAEKRLASVGPS